MQAARESLQQALNVQKKHACCTEGMQHCYFCCYAQFSSNKEGKKSLPCAEFFEKRLFKMHLFSEPLEMFLYLALHR